MANNNPITVSDLPIGVYTVEVTAVNSNDMSIENNRIVEMITVCDKSTATDESGMFVCSSYVHMCIIRSTLEMYIQIAVSVSVLMHNKSSFSQIFTLLLIPSDQPFFGHLTDCTLGNKMTFFNT